MYLVSTEDIMADWQILLTFSLILLIISGISLISHLRTPENKRSKGIIHPFSFMLLVAMAVLFIAYILYLLDI